MTSSIATLTREELYNLVWKYPMSEIKRMYYSFGSDYCSKMDIPMPKPSYWKVQETGSPQSPRAPLLPTNKRIKFIKLQLRRAEKIEQSTPIEIMANVIEDTLGDILDIQEQNSDLHKMVVATKYQLETHPTSMGLLRSNIYHLDLKTSPQHLMSCIGFYNCLIRGLEKRGHKIEVRTQKGQRGTFAVVEGESVRIGVTEKTIKEQRYSNGRQYFGKSSPTGSIKVRIGNSEWLLSPVELEFNLATLIARIEIEAFAMKARTGDSTTTFKVQTDQAKYLQCEKELADFKILIDKANRWETANTIRRYLDHVTRGGGNENERRVLSPHWVTWANEKLDWYDPAIECEDEIFEMVDRNTLEIKAIDGTIIKDNNS